LVVKKLKEQKNGWNYRKTTTTYSHKRKSISQDIDAFLETEQGIWNKKVYFVPTFNDCSKGINSIPHVSVATVTSIVISSIESLSVESFSNVVLVVQHCCATDIFKGTMSASVKCIWGNHLISMVEL